MRTPQHKIDSGFGYRSSAADVLDGIDLSGRTAIVTGGYSGHGVEVDELDLSDLDSVNAFAGRVVDNGSSIDILINNAAVMACPETRIGPGWESQFATNHLGHYTLANRLWPV